MITPIRPAGSARVLVSVLSALLLAMLVIIATPGSARAEQSLVGSDPQPQAELERAPGWVNLAFDSRVDAGIAKVLVLNADGQNVTTGQLIVEFNTITTQLIDDLPEGTYTVQYRSDDEGDPLGGSFQFSYGSGSFSSDADTTWQGADSEPEVIKNPDPNATTTPAPQPSAEATEPPPVDPTQEVPDPDTSDPDAPVGTPGGADATPPADPADTPDSGSSPAPWILGGIGVVVALAAAGLYLRSRQNSRP